MPKEKKILIASIALFCAAVAVAVYFFFQTVGARREIKTLRENPQAALVQETKDLVARVGELIVLPEDEVPTIATVNDPERLKSQPFFAKAKVGDKVLMYQRSKKAILYDPAAHKILEVASLDFGARP